MERYSFHYDDYEFKFETSYCAVPVFVNRKYSQLNSHDKKIVDQLLEFFNCIPSPDSSISLYESRINIPYLSLGD